MSRPGTPQTITPAVDPEEFMALLLHAQKEPCECVFGKFFRELGERMVKQHIKEKKGSG